MTLHPHNEVIEFLLLKKIESRIFFNANSFKVPLPLSIKEDPDNKRI